MNLERLEEENAVAEVLAILVDQEVLQRAALGIAKLVIAQGTDDLTTARSLYSRYIGT